MPKHRSARLIAEADYLYFFKWRRVAAPQGDVAFGYLEKRRQEAQQLGVGLAILRRGSQTHRPAAVLTPEPSFSWPVALPNTQREHSMEVSSNDADRLRKYRARFDLSWTQVQGA